MNTTRSFSVTKRMTFEAAHLLSLDYKSLCANIHGHSYKVEVTVFGNELNHNGMLMEFTDLKVIKDWIDENWDHALIISTVQSGIKENLFFSNQRIFELPMPNVTAENMCKFIWDLVRVKLGATGTDGRQFGFKVRIWETENNFAEYGDHV